MTPTISRALIGAGSLCFLFASSPVGAIELITNGDFETGTFAGWTVTDLPGGSGSWFIDDADGLTPFAGLPTVGPAGGLFYAVTDQGGPGTHVLEQFFIVPAPAASVILSFDMFVNDSDSGPIVNPAGLDHNAGGNQHARVDILSPFAPPFDTGAGVLANYYLGVDPQIGNPNPYTSYSFDITGLVGGGGLFKIRFAEVDNQLFLNQGVDNVSIDFTRVPEPASIGLALLAAVALTWLRRRAA